MFSIFNTWSKWSIVYKALSQSINSEQNYIQIVITWQSHILWCSEVNHIHMDISTVMLLSFPHHEGGVQSLSNHTMYQYQNALLDKEKHNIKTS